MATISTHSAISALVKKRICEPNQYSRTISHDVGSKKNVVCKTWLSKKWPIISSTNHGKLPPIRASSLHDCAILDFYDHINDKNLNKIGEFISDDCCFDDYSFLEPFTGKKLVMQFLKELVDCMGNNLKFVVQNVSQGDPSSVAILWCLEWRGKRIPLTRGCTFYECSKHEGRLLIKHAHVLTEWPIKPGSLVLTLLKLVTYLFDEFPETTEKFLEKPAIFLRFLSRIYCMLLEPLLKPVFAFYNNVLKFVAHLFLNVFKILLHVFRIFSSKKK